MHGLAGENESWGQEFTLQYPGRASCKVTLKNMGSTEYCPSCRTKSLDICSNFMLNPTPILTYQLFQTTTILGYSWPPERSSGIIYILVINDIHHNCVIWIKYIFRCGAFLIPWRFFAPSNWQQCRESFQILLNPSAGPL